MEFPVDTCKSLGYIFAIFVIVIFTSWASVLAASATLRVLLLLKNETRPQFLGAICLRWIQYLADWGSIVFLREFNLDLDLNLFVQMLPFHPRPVVPSENSLKIYSSKSKWKLDVQCTLYTHLRTMYLRTRILMKTGFWTSWLSKYRPESEKIFEACLGVSLLLCEPLQQILHLRFQDVFN